MKKIQKLTLGIILASFVTVGCSGGEESAGNVDNDVQKSAGASAPAGLDGAAPAGGTSAPGSGPAAGGGGASTPTSTP